MGIVGKCVGTWGEEKDVGRGMKGRCRKVCWGVKEVRGDVGKGEGGDVGKCVVTSPHGNFATVTSPQKLRHMVTLPHFEKVRVDVGIVGKCVGMWGEEGEMWEEV